MKQTIVVVAVIIFFSAVTAYGAIAATIAVPVPRLLCDAVKKEAWVTSVARGGGYYVERTETLDKFCK